MITARVPIPDELSLKEKRLDAEYEMMFAAIVRHCLDRATPAYPKRAQNWIPPKPVKLKMRIPVENNDWRLLANDSDYAPRRA